MLPPTATEPASEEARWIDADLAVVLVVGSVTAGVAVLAWFLVRTRRRGAGRSR